MENIPLPQSVLPGVFALLQSAVSTYKKSSKRFLRLSLIPLVFAVPGVIISLINGPAVPMPGSPGLFVLLMIVAIGGFVVEIVTIVAIVQTIGRAETGGQVSIGDTYRAAFKLFWSLLWVIILSELALIGGSILFIVPGIIVAIYLSFSFFTAVLDGYRGLQALSASFYYISGYWWAILGRLLALGFALCAAGLAIFFVVSGLFALIGLTFGVPSAFTAIASLILVVISWGVIYPLVCAYAYQLYAALKGTKPAPVVEVDLKKSRAWFMGLSIFGLVAGGCVAFVLPMIFIIP